MVEQVIRKETVGKHLLESMFLSFFLETMQREVPRLLGYAEDVAKVRIGLINDTVINKKKASY